MYMYTYIYIYIYMHIYIYIYIHIFISFFLAPSKLRTRYEQRPSTGLPSSVQAQVYLALANLIVCQRFCRI